MRQASERSSRYDRLHGDEDLIEAERAFWRRAVEEKKADEERDDDDRK